MPIFHARPYVFTTNSDGLPHWLYTRLPWVLLVLSAVWWLASCKLSRDLEARERSSPEVRAKLPSVSRHPPTPLEKGPQLLHGSTSVTSNPTTPRRT